MALGESQISGRQFVHRFGTALVVVLLSTVLAIGYGYWFAARKVAHIPKVRMDTSVLEPGGNYLLIGSDSRAFVDTPADVKRFGSEQQASGQRSDTIMVAHVNADGSGVLVSFPRDLWVAIPGIGKAKINAAFNAGPQRVIETIENDFNVPISHYLQVDFAGFRNIVNAIGSVPIYFPTPARDSKSGLNVSQAGCAHLNGDQALAYVRSRYYESLRNGKWTFDPTSDLGRVKRQQYFLRTLAQQAVHASERAPWRAPGIIDKFLANLQRDPKLTFSSVRALAFAFHGGRTDLETMTLPTKPEVIGGQDVLVLDTGKAEPMLARLRSTSSRAPVKAPAGIAPGSVRVIVHNGSGRTGAGASAVSALRDFGFSVPDGASNADRSDYAVTEVRYAPGNEKKALFVLSYLGGAGRVVPSGTTADADVDLVIGRDHPEITSPPTTAPATSAPARGGSRSKAPAPAAPPAVGCPRT